MRRGFYHFQSARQRGIPPQDSTVKKLKGRTCVRPRGDEVKIRLHPGAQKGDATNLGSLSEPRRKQNLYANPKRTAKLSNNIFSDAPHPEKVQTFLKKSFAPFSAPSAAATNATKLHY